MLSKIVKQVSMVKLAVVLVMVLNLTGSLNVSAQWTAPWQAKWFSQEYAADDIPNPPSYMVVPVPQNGEKAVTVTWLNTGTETWYQGQVVLDMWSGDFACSGSHRYGQLQQSQVGRNQYGTFTMYLCGNGRSATTYRHAIDVRVWHTSGWTIDEHPDTPCTAAGCTWANTWWHIGVIATPITPTPTPQDCARYQSDVNYSDGTQVSAGQTFTKKWTLNNCGDTTWDSNYKAVRVSGSYGPTSFSVSGAPGTVSVQAQFTAPTTPGTYRATYQIEGPRGRFGTFWVEIVVPVTVTPVTVTPVPQDCAAFVTDVTIPDGTQFTPGASFQKIWRLKNCGNTTWGNGYSAQRVEGVLGTPFNVNTVIPGQTIDLALNMIAPNTSGIYKTYYQLQGPSGLFGPRFYMSIRVMPKPGSNENWVPDYKRAYLNQRSLTPYGDSKCGSASASMLLAMNGLIGKDYNSMRDVANAIYPDSIEGGTIFASLIATQMRKLGLNVTQKEYTQNKAWDTLKEEVNAGRPVFLRTGRNLTSKGHFIVAVGYQEEGSKRNIIVYDPFGEWKGSQNSYNLNDKIPSSEKGKWKYYSFEKVFNNPETMITAFPKNRNRNDLVPMDFASTPPDIISNEPEELGIYEGTQIEDYWINLIAQPTQLTWNPVSNFDVKTYRVTKAISGTDYFTPITVTNNPIYNIRSTRQQSSQDYCYQIDALNSNGEIVDTSNPVCIADSKTQPADCNHDSKIDAGDLSATILEIFDGDGNLPTNAPSGTFAGDSVGCNANQDTVIDAGDLSCTILTIFKGAGACGKVGATELNASPMLQLGQASLNGNQLTVPVVFNPNGNDISNMVFSIDYAAEKVRFDSTDKDGDGTPDGVKFNLPTGFNGSVTVDTQDSNGELDFVVGDLAMPLAAMSAGTVATLTFEVVDNTDLTSVVKFAASPAISFGDTNGQSVAVQTEKSKVYLPIIVK